MTRLAGITTLYALIAALVLVAPLSASQAPPTDNAPAEPAAPTDSLPPAEAEPEVTTPEAAPPEAAVPEPPPPEPSAAPQEAAPSQAAAPGEPAPPAAAPAPAQPAAAAPAAEEPAAPVTAERRRGRAGDAPRAKAAADTSVTISDFQFAPGSVTVDVGDTVTWNNDGPTPHSATADDGDFDTGIFNAGQSRSHTFEEAGTFSYFCTPHPNMQGTITVRAASSGGGGDAGEGSDTSGSTGSESGATDSGSGDSDDSSGAALPATGLDTSGLAVLGLMTLALGVWLRRRSATGH